MKKLSHLFLLSAALSAVSHSAMAQEWPVNSVATSSALWPHAHLKDGNLGTVWSSNGHPDANHAEWLAYWFDGFRPVNYIKLYPRFHQGKTLGLPTSINLYWSDGSTWHFAKTYTNIAVQNNYVILPLPTTVNANGIQVVANQLGADDFNNYYFQLSEVAAGLTQASTERKLALDFFGRTLPGSPTLNMINQVPKTVTVGNIEARLYRMARTASEPPDEGTPAQLLTYGAAKRECLLINAPKPNQQWSCFATFPYGPTALPSTPESDALCGYPVPPAMLVACNDGQCVSEIFNQACETRYPSLTTDRSYPSNKPKANSNFGSYISDPDELSKQEFSSKYDVTGNLHTAMEMLRQGRIPVVAVGGIMFDFNGIILPDAEQRLNTAIARFPQLFAQNAVIKIIDEPFMHKEGKTDAEKKAIEENLQQQIKSVQVAIAMLRNKIPTAQLGINVAPVWHDQPNIIPSTESVIKFENGGPNRDLNGQLQWVATDLYEGSLYLGSDPHVYRAVTMANQFSEHIANKFPNVARWLIVQGFAPHLSMPPQTWNEASGAATKTAFKKFMTSMAKAAESYDGTIVWGWNSVSEVDDAFAGKNFPDDIKKIYQEPVCTSITFTPNTMPASGGLATVKANCNDPAGILSYAWTVNGTLYPGNESSNSSPVSPNTGTSPLSYVVCVTASNVARRAQPVCATLHQEANTLSAPQSPPAPPAMGFAVGNAVSATVTFTPSAMGSGTLINYTVTCGGAFGSGSSSPITVTGVPKDTPYFCKVKSNSSAGSSSWSAWSNPIFP